MGYSLRTRSASTTTAAAGESVAAPAKKAAVTKKTTEKSAPAAKKSTAVAKKTAAATSKATPKKAPAKKAAEPKVEVEKKEPEVKEVKEVKKTVKKAPAKKAAPKKTTKATAASKTTKATTKAKTAKAKTVATKSTATKTSATKAKVVTAPKPVRSSRRNSSIASIPAPLVTIEEVSTPSLPEIEPILHEEPKKFESEKVIEVVEGEVVNSHIRFSDDEEADSVSEEPVVEDIKTSPSIKEVSIHSSDFEALDDLSKDEPNPFELYNSESEAEAEEEEFKFSPSCDEFDEEEEEQKTVLSQVDPVSNGHSAFEAFTSQEGSKTFNWNHTGSTYYNKTESDEFKASETKASEAETSEPKIIETKTNEPVQSSTKSPITSEPTVISNPFGYGFTFDNTQNRSSYSAPSAFTSHFQSVSSPLDKLCNLTKQQQQQQEPIISSSSNPVKVAGSFDMTMSSTTATSSYLPTSPMMMMKSKSPSEQGDKESRSPSVIQSIIVDDKHEDFSAF